MITYHDYPEGKSVFECPFEQHEVPGQEACEGCKYLTDIDGDGNEAPSCMLDEDNIQPLEDMEECPDGNTKEYCSLDEPGDCIVGQPISPDEMMKLLDL
jgi:hypothetical protein